MHAQNTQLAHASWQTIKANLKCGWLFDNFQPWMGQLLGAQSIDNCYCFPCFWILTNQGWFSVKKNFCFVLFFVFKGYVCCYLMFCAKIQKITKIGILKKTISKSTFFSFFCRKNPFRKIAQFRIFVFYFFVFFLFFLSNPCLTI